LIFKFVEIIKILDKKSKNELKNKKQVISLVHTCAGTSFEVGGTVGE
jgi:hypothetical protein